MEREGEMHKFSACKMKVYTGDRVYLYDTFSPGSRDSIYSAQACKPHASEDAIMVNRMCIYMYIYISVCVCAKLMAASLETPAYLPC